jgi:DNA-binding SARP family transcriptional activator/tetratricopeptide (TPR) repeat protein
LSAERLEFSLLGPLAVASEQGPLDLGAPKHRALLALLLLEPGRVVSVDRLMDQLWHGEPPAAATSTLQAYVSNLRRVLEPNRTAGAPATVLVTRPPGYVLDIAPEQVDAARFERNITSAIEAHGRGRLDDAAVFLADALSLWRGQPLADVAYEQWAQTECERLKELYLIALETQLAVDLGRGRHSSVAVEAERLAKEHPVRERFRELLMLALYRSGRQADALRAYQDARDVLVEELGIEPGPELRVLEQRILAQDPTLGWEPPPEAAGRFATAEPPPSATFVGRTHERARLVGRVAEVRHGSGRLALLSGEPGIGKTRLCEELSAHARAQDMRVIWARGWEGDGAPAFWPWVQVLRTLADETPAETLTAALGGSGADIARVVPDFAPFVTVADDAPDAESARFRFFEAVGSLLVALSDRRPLLIVLDDLHWADQSSLRLLEFAVAGLRQSAVLFVGTFRDAEARQPPLANTLATLARTPELERLTLSGLSVDEVGDYVAAVVGDDADPNLADSLHDRTAGNPFFVAELVRLLQDEGKLSAGAETALVPEGVRDVVRTRLARLPEEAVAVLTAGAIAGREFDIALVAHVCGIDEDSALDLVEAAWMIGIVDEAHDGLGHFRFSHELVRDTLVEGLTSLRRIRLHRRTGEAIEELHGERNPGFLTECAHHFAEAAPGGDALKAVLYNQRAADRLNAQLAYEDAIPIYERAIELVETYDVGSWQTRTDLLIGLGWALRATGRLGDARVVLRRAMERARSEGDPVRIARAVLGIGGGGFWGWWDEFGVADLDLVAYLERALDALDDDDSVLRCELLARLAVEGYFASSRERRRTLSADALAMARRLGDPVALTAALASELLVCWNQDNLQQRLELDDELVSVAAGNGIAYAELIGRHFRMVDHLESGDRSAADADFAACELLAERLGHYAFHVQLAWYRSMLAFIEGRLDDAERLVRDAFERNVASNEPAAWMAYGAQMFRLRREQGRHAELETTLRTTAERQPHLAVPLMTGVATIAGEHGRPDEARELLDTVLAARPFDNGNDLLVPLHAAQIAEAAVAARHDAAATVVAEVLRDHAGPVALLATGHLCFGAVDRLRGDVARTLGRLDEAVECYERAIDIEAGVGARIYANRSRLGLALALRARAGDGDGERVEALAPAVVRVAQELGTPMVAAAGAALLD